jgi:hypothetical protein
LPEQAIEGRAADGDLLLLRQQLLQMTHIQVGVLAIHTRQRQNPPVQRRIGAIGRAATTVAVDDSGKTFLTKAGQPPAKLTGPHSQ